MVPLSERVAKRPRTVVSLSPWRVITPRNRDDSLEFHAPQTVAAEALPPTGTAPVPVASPPAAPTFLTALPIHRDQPPSERWACMTEIIRERDRHFSRASPHTLPGAAAPVDADGRRVRYERPVPIRFKVKLVDDTWRTFTTVAWVPTAEFGGPSSALGSQEEWDWIYRK